MNARKKMNSNYIYGSLILAAVLGAITESWIVFLFVAGLLIAGGLHDGNIRPGSRYRP